MSDSINPSHYKRLPAEAIEIIEAMIAGAPDNKAAYLHGQAGKYDLRLWGKGKSLEDYLTDWQKHIWYALRLESHLLELIEKQKSDEKQKAADLQSLKDYPFGEPDQPAWTPKIGDWVRIKKPSSDKRDSVLWSSFMDEHDKEVVQVKEIKDGAMVHGEWFFPFDWLEPAEQPHLTPEPPDGWRWIEVGEVIRKGDKGFENGRVYAIEPMKIGMTLQSHWKPVIRRNRFEVGEKVVDIGDNPPIVYTVDLIRADGAIIAYNRGVGHAFSPDKLAPYIEDAVEVTGEATWEVKPPDGWRFLERGETVRDGDMLLRNGILLKLAPDMIGRSCYKDWMPIVRRNRFDVGEKVVSVLDGFEFVVVGRHSRFNDIYVARNKITAKIHNILDRLLAPYIEDAK